MAPSEKHQVQREPSVKYADRYADTATTIVVPQDVGMVFSLFPGLLDHPVHIEEPEARAALNARLAASRRYRERSRRQVLDAQSKFRDLATEGRKREPHARAAKSSG